MNTLDHAADVDHLLGPPRGPSDLLVRLGPERCKELVALILRATPGARMRPQPWADSPNGLTLCVGSDYDVELGLDFPAGGRGGPDGGWVRSVRRGGAVHWRIGRVDAAYVLALLMRSLPRRRTWTP